MIVATLHTIMVALYILTHLKAEIAWLPQTQI